jgi:endonuclease/exonuclease/phosphatase family metal-dependent hydrolase
MYNTLRVLFILVLFFPALPLYLEGQDLKVMFYNVENLFDTSDDPARDDEEFLPQGSRRWTPRRYQGKLNAIARAVSAAGEWDLPSLIGLCEIENEDVLRDLAYGTILSAGNYGIVHRDSPDPRGIDLGLLYRRDWFSVSAVETWLPHFSDDLQSSVVKPLSDSLTVTTRNLLYVKIVRGSDTLHLVLCHLPSRRGGVLAAGALRKRMILLAAGKTDSLLRSAGRNAAVIVMGDFNTTPGDPLISVFIEKLSMENLSAGPASEGKGSYRYQGTWEMIDQVLVSGGMTDSTASFSVLPGSFRVVDEPFLLTEDLTYPGLKPFPAYGGYRWSGGYSDHLPVIFTIRQE